MFAELSSRWYTCNPLDKSKPAEPPAPPAPAAPPAAPALAQSTAQNIFASSSNSAASAPAPSPFSTAPAQTKPQNLFAEKSAESAPAPSPFSTAPSNTSAAGAEQVDYHKLLTEFYQKHNAQKVSEVAKTLEKYKVKNYLCHGDLTILANFAPHLNHVFIIK